MYEVGEYFGFRLEVDGTIIYSRETQDVEVDERENLTLSQAKTILCTYRKEIWEMLYKAIEPSGSETFRRESE